MVNMNCSFFGSRDDWKLVLLIAGVATCSSAVAQLVFTFSPEGTSFLIAEALGLRFYLAPTGAAVIVVALVSAELFLVLRIAVPKTKSSIIIVLVFAILAGTTSLLVGRRLFLAYLPEAFPTMSLLLALGVFAGFFLTFLTLIGVASNVAKNATLTIFSITTGALIASSFPTLPVLITLIVLVAVDFLLAYSRRTQAEEDLARDVAMTAVVTRKWMIGVGDLTTYAILMAHSLVAKGIYVFCLMLGTVVCGALLTMRWAARSNVPYVPGLLLTAGPAVVMLAVAWLMGSAT